MAEIKVGGFTASSGAEAVWLIAKGSWQNGYDRTLGTVSRGVRLFEIVEYVGESVKSDDKEKWAMLNWVVVIPHSQP